MPDDLINLEDILNQAENATPAQLQAMLPPATNPGAHAPATGNLSSDEIIAKQVNETPTEVKADVQAEAVSSESQVETETQSEEQIQISPQEALFDQLRVQFPNESLVTLAARAEAAFASAPAEVDADNNTDILAQILSEYEETVQTAKEAKEQLTKLTNPEDGTLVEYTAEIYEAGLNATKAEMSIEPTFLKLAHEANEAVAKEFPELDDEFSPAFVAVQSVVDADPSLRESSPVAIANLARHIAINLRNAAAAAQAVAPKTLPSPTRVPAPAGPKPPVAGLSSSVQASHASAAAPTPGAQQGNDIVSKIRSAASLDDLEGMFFGKGLRPTVLS